MVCIGICSDCRLGESQRNEVAVESIWPGLLNIGNVREGCDGEGCVDVDVDVAYELKYINTVQRKTMEVYL